MKIYSIYSSISPNVKMEIVGQKERDLSSTGVDKNFWNWITRGHFESIHGESLGGICREKQEGMKYKNKNYDIFRLL